MNNIVFLGCLALVSCIGMALGYGTVMTTNQKFAGYPFMANAGSLGYGSYGYMPYMGTSGFGGFLGGGGGGSSLGMGGMFGNIIQLFIFIFIINILFSSTGISSGGLGIGRGASKVGSDYHGIGRGASKVGSDYHYDDFY